MWRGYESTGSVVPENAMCRVVVDLLGMEPGAAAVSIRMGKQTSGSLPESQEDRLALADVLKREFLTAVDQLLLD